MFSDDESLTEFLILQRTAAFGGSGQSLNGRSVANPQTALSSNKGKSKEKQTTESSASWTGEGRTLGSSAPREMGTVGAGGARVPRVPQRNSKGKAKERSPSPDIDWGVDDDEDVIMIDSD